MKFALITNGQYSPLQRRRGFHMFLAQYFEDASYASMAYDLRCADAFMILDNGVAEGESVPWERVQYIAKEFRFDEVIVPDVMRNASETLTLSEQVCKENITPACNRMLVPHGENWQDWQLCVDIMCRSMQFASFGVPKYLESFPGGRKVAVDFLLGMDKGKHNIHMLGLWGNPLKEIASWGKYRARIRSLDSAAPFAWAQRSSLLQTSEEAHISVIWNGRADYEILMQNVVTMDGICNEQVSWS